MYNYSKIKLVVAFLSLFVLITFIQDTYAKYNSEATGAATVDIARWQILINDQDIITDSFITNVITPTIIGDSNVKDGVVAPLSIGYFDLILDYTDVDVSFEYAISTSIAPTSGVTDFIVTGYSEDGGAVVPVLDGNLEGLGQEILITELTRTKNLRVYITWDDSITETMNNSEDTMASINLEKAILNVAVNFTQVTN